MAITKGVETYATVVEAEAYFVNSLDVAAWTSAADVEKERALVTATRILDSLAWTGIVVSESQLLAFPRYGEYFDTKLGYVIALPDTVPTRIIEATFELAYHLLNNDGLQDSTGDVNDLKVDVIELSGIISPSLLPAVVRRSIRPLLVNQGVRSWWRAN